MTLAQRRATYTEYHESEWELRRGQIETVLEVVSTCVICGFDILSDEARVEYGDGWAHSECEEEE